MSDTDARVPWLDLLLLFSASRIALLIVGILSTGLVGSGLAVMKGNLVYHEQVWRPLEIWARWDSEWYLLIAKEGYSGPEVRAHYENLGVPYEPEATSGFLPLYPIMIRLLSPVMGGVGAGILISNVALWLALVLLYRLTHDAVTGPEEKRRLGGLAACAALLLHPMSLFLSAVYAESLFLALSLATWDFARRGRFAAAGISGALATLTRPFGVLLIAPVVWQWWAERHRAAALAWVTAIPAALGGYMIYCGTVFSDPLAFVHRQSRWRGGMSGPWHAFIRWWETGPAPHGAHNSTLEMLIAVATLVALPFVFRALGGALGFYAAICVLAPLGATVWSFGRLSLAIFPIFMMIGAACAEGRTRVATAYLLSGSALSGLLMALFANWWWAG